jgi:hypothetical protein
MAVAALTAMANGGTSPRSEARRLGFGELQPEIVLPGQLDGQEQALWRQPERSLMLAVLEEAISTYRKYATAETRRGRRLFSEVETWCESDDASWPFSFVAICQELGIDAAWLRDGLFRWRDARRALPREHARATAPTALRRRSSGSRTRATSHAGLAPSA